MWLLVDICKDNSLLKIIKLLRSFLQILQILVPIGLIVLGSIDFGKSVISSNEDDIKKNQRRFMRRCLGAVMVFLVAVIVMFAMDFIGNNKWQECWKGNPTPETSETPENTDDQNNGNQSDPNGGNGGYNDGTSNGGGGNGGGPGAF